MMAPTLRALCDNPLLLRQVLGYWKREGDFPRNIEFLFRSWLDNVLETAPSDPTSTVRREQALTLLAQATVNSPIAKTEALALFDRHNMPSGILNELIGCDALRIDGSVVEVRHEALADYLRAAALASTENDRVLALLPSLPMPADSFFPVLLMALLGTRALQSALWKRLSETGLGRYLDALRYRFDLSDELKRSDPTALSRHYLEDLLEGIETPLDCFFTQLREAVVGNLVGEQKATLAATGVVSAQPAALHYKLHALEPGQGRVTVAAPTFPGILRGVNLDLARYRIDSARLLGMTLLRDTLLTAVKQQQLKGGLAWAAERLLGRVRYLAEGCGLDLSIADNFDKLDAVLKPLSDGWVDAGAFSGGERFPIHELLDDIATLRAAGNTAPDPWWLRFGSGQCGSYASRRHSAPSTKRRIPSYPDRLSRNCRSHVPSDHRSGELFCRIAGALEVYGGEYRTVARSAIAPTGVRLPLHPGEKPEPTSHLPRRVRPRFRLTGPAHPKRSRPLVGPTLVFRISRGQWYFYRGTTGGNGLGISTVRHPLPIRYAYG